MTPGNGTAERCNRSDPICIMISMGRRSSGGPDAEYVDFVRTHSDRLLKLAFLLCANPYSAEDLVQETLLQAYRKWPQVQVAKNQGAYVRRILVNLYLTERRQNRPAVSPFPLRDDIPSKEIDGFNVLEKDALARAMVSLSRREQLALVLRYYNGLDDDAIASAMNCRRGTVRSLVSRGLMKLRKNTHLLSEDETTRY